MLGKSEYSSVIKQISNGDELAFEQLFSVFYSRLMHFAISFVKSNDLADEIVMDVFMKLWNGRKRIECVKNIETYLFIAVRNASYSALKSEKKFSFEELDNLDVQLAKYKTTPEMLIISQENIEAINDAIELLPAKCKLIFKLIREEGFNKHEVSKILNISVKTIDNQIAIAVKKIADVLNIDLSTKDYSSHIQSFLLFI